MGGKKTGTRFTIQFRETDQAHLQVAELLNSRGHRGKAQYIVDAVMHYEGRDASTPAQIDEALVEAVVIRILQDRGKFADKLASPSTLPAPPIEEVRLDEAMESIGADGLHAIAGALDMFRRK